MTRLSSATRAILAIVMLVLVASACSNSSLDEVDSAPATDPSPAPASNAEPAASTGTSAAPACLYIGLSSLDWIELEVSMTNDTGSLLDGRLDYELYNDDELLLEGREIVSRLEPGESIRFFRNSQTEIPADAGEIRCEISGFEDNFRTPPAYDESAGGGGTPVEVSGLGTANVDVSVINQLGTATELIVHFAVYDPDGVRLGYNNWIANEVYNPGDTIEDTRDSRAVIPDGLSLGDLTCRIIAIDEW